MSWSTLRPIPITGNERVACDNCEWYGDIDEVNDIKDPSERLNAGSVVPAGQCPKCDCLAYVTESVKLTSIPAIKEAVDAGKDVRAGNDNYRVIKDSIGQYLIHFTGTPENWIGLHVREGTDYEHRLNMTPVYIKES